MVRQATEHPRIIVDLGVGELTTHVEAAAGQHRTHRADIARALVKGEFAAMSDATVLIVSRRTADALPAAMLIRRIREVAPHVGIFVCASLGASWLAKRRNMRWRARMRCSTPSSNPNGGHSRTS